MGPCESTSNGTERGGPGRSASERWVDGHSGGTTVQGVVPAHHTDNQRRKMASSAVRKLAGASGPVSMFRTSSCRRRATLRPPGAAAVPVMCLAQRLHRATANRCVPRGCGPRTRASSSAPRLEGGELLHHNRFCRRLRPATLRPTPHRCRWTSCGGYVATEKGRHRRAHRASMHGTAPGASAPRELRCVHPPAARATRLDFKAGRHKRHGPRFPVPTMRRGGRRYK